MLLRDQLRRELVERLDLLLLRAQRLAEVLVLPDQRLDAVQRVAEVLILEESLHAHTREPYFLITNKDIIMEYI